MKTRQIIISIAVLGVILGLGFLNNGAPVAVEAGSADNVSGFAWSSNIGWISFNSVSDGSAADYGVNINPIGDLAGFAWANPRDGAAGTDNIGWLSFYPNEIDLANCPEAPSCPRANLNFAANQLSGWARFLTPKTGAKQICDYQCSLTRVNYGSQAACDSACFQTADCIADVCPLGGYPCTTTYSSYKYQKDTTAWGWQTPQASCDTSSSTLDCPDTFSALASDPEIVYDQWKMYISGTFIGNYSAVFNKVGIADSPPTCAASETCVESCTTVDPAGGWGGWVKLSGTADNGSSYGVIRKGCNLEGYAWGGDVAGWIEFNPAFGGVVLDASRCEINQPPTADAYCNSRTPDDNCSVLGGSTVTLYGSGSDPEGSSLAFTWSWAPPVLVPGDADADNDIDADDAAKILSSNGGSSCPLERCDLNNDGVVSIGDIQRVANIISGGPLTFTAPNVSADTPYTFSLVVNDGAADSAPDSAVVTVQPVQPAVVNQPPVAVASDKSVNEGESVILDGSASWDPEDGSVSSYSWSGSGAGFLNNSNIAAPIFNTAGLDVAATTIYPLKLTVADSQGLTNSIDIIVTVLDTAILPTFSFNPDSARIEGEPLCGKVKSYFSQSIIVEPGSFPNNVSLSLSPFANLPSELNCSLTDSLLTPAEFSAGFQLQCTVDYTQTPQNCASIDSGFLILGEGVSDTSTATININISSVSPIFRER